MRKIFNLIFSILLLASCTEKVTLSREDLADKIKGGWAGQTFGCTYGGPTEFRYRGQVIPDDFVAPWEGENRIQWYFDNSPGLYDDVYMDLSFLDVIDRKGMDAPAEDFAEAFARASYPLWHANQAARYNILRYSSDSNPLVVEINNELSAMHTAVLGGLDNEKVRLEQLIQAEQSNQNKYAGRISNTPKLERDLRAIERQQEVKEQLYLYLLQKREENELTQAFTAYNTRIVANPYGGLAPVAPKKSSIMMLALLLGLFLPLNVIYLKMVLNTVVRGRKDMEGLATPFVGEIPQYGSKRTSKNSKEELVVKANSRSVINEAFRVVRSNLEFMLDNGQRKVIMVTSFNPGSGKTFIAANLAASLAVKGKKVVAVDFDMRHASLSNYVGRPGQGLSNYLAGIIDSCPILEHPEQKNLSIIPSGTIPPNPTELLYSDRLSALLEKLKADYDLIFLDCPPVEMLADASIIARYADKTLFVVRSGLMEREMLPVIDSYYEEQKLPNMVVLLNGTEKYNGHYGYHYGYYHHYGDYYNDDKVTV